MHRGLRSKTASGLLMLFLIILTAGTTFAETAIYTYDAAHRLIQVNENGTIVEYHYDSVGNLEQRLRPYSITADPSSKSFGTTFVGASPSTQIFTIRNESTSDLAFNSGGLTGADAGSFAISSSNCPGILAQQTQCTIEVSFSPVSAGAKAANLLLTFSNPSGLTLTAPLLGAAYYRPFRIVRGSPVYFDTLQPAYDVAASGEVIQAQAGTLTESIIFNRDIAVTVEGGYDSDFASNNNGLTLVKGSLHTSVGSTVIKNIRTIQ